MDDRNVVKNIYYMLAYAFGALHLKDFEHVDAEAFGRVHDLFAAILVQGVASQIKRGFARDYVPHSEALAGIKGKLNLSESIQKQTLLERKMICQYDLFSENILLNQILKTTMRLLLCKGDVAALRRDQLRKVLLYFHDVDDIPPQNVKWSAISYHRHNQTYQLLINICWFVLKGLLIDTKRGDVKLRKIVDEQRMSSLYEKFVREFYKKEYSACKVSSAQVKWDIVGLDTEMLPAMQTDTMISAGGKTLIIDTKYYSRTTQLNASHGNEKRTLHSANLYQIYTYVKNCDKGKTGDVAGVLLYAHTGEALTPDHSYNMAGNWIAAKTLDLRKDFSEIRAQLDAIVERYLPVSGSSAMI